jgi:hypothetical protein
MITCRSYPFLTKRKAFATYRWSTHSRWQFPLNPMVIYSDTTYKTWLAYLQKTQQIYMSYITTDPPSGACVFNAARTTLHML